MIVQSADTRLTDQGTNELCSGSALSSHSFFSRLSFLASLARGLEPEDSFILQLDRSCISTATTHPFPLMVIVMPVLLLCRKSTFASSPYQRFLDPLYHWDSFGFTTMGASYLSFTSLLGMLSELGSFQTL